MNKADRFIAALLAVGLVAFLIPFAQLGVDAHHDGIMLKPALDVLNGQVLFRDTFSQYGALSTYLQVAALSIQPSLLTLRLLTVGVYCITLLVLYAAWRLILPRSLTIVACGLFMLFIPAYEKNWVNQYWVLLPWSSAYALLFQSLGLYALLNIIRHEQATRWALLLGLATAWVFWCRQPAGILMAGGVTIIWLALAWTGWKPLAASRRQIVGGMMAGFFGVHLAMLAGIWLSGGGPEWWYQNFTWPGKYAAGVGDALWRGFAREFLHLGTSFQLLALLLAATLPGLCANAGRRWPRRPMIAWYGGVAIIVAWQWRHVVTSLDLRAGGWTCLLPAAIGVQALVVLWTGFIRRTAPRDANYHLVAATAALALCALAQYYPVPDTWHTTWALAPTFGLLVFSLWRWSGWPASVTAGMLTLAFLPSLHSRIESARRVWAEPYVTLSRPAVLRGMKVLPAQARFFDGLADVLDRVLRVNPEIPSALVGNDALYLCFTPNGANPVPYFVTWGGLTDRAGELRRWTQIMERRSLIFFVKANWTAANEFYRNTGYVPLAYFPEEAIEVAVPPEVADAMGVTTYGAAKSPAASLPQP